MLYYYYCPVNFYYCGSGDFKVANSTEIAPPEFEQSTQTAFFNIEKKEWYLKDQVLMGNFINLKTFELKKEILAKEKQDYLDEVSFCKKKIKEILQDYAEAQKLLMINGKTVLTRIQGEQYNDIQREFNKSSWEKDKIVTLVIQDINDEKRYKLIIPRSFGKFLLSKIQKISAHNYDQKEIALQKIEKKELTFQEIFNLKVNFLFNNEINIETEADNYINDDYYKTKYPVDIEFVIKLDKHFFTELDAK